MDDSWRRLHPASVVVNLLPQAWRFFKGVWPLFLTGALGAPAAWDTVRVDAALFALFFLGTLASTLLHWATLRYRVTESRLEIESGFVQRQYRSFDIDKIENVERVHHLIHRWFGVEEVRIETASGTEVEGLLSALSAEDAASLASAVAPRSRALEQALFRMTWREVVTSALLSPRWGFGFASLGTIFSFMQGTDLIMVRLGLGVTLLLGALVGWSASVAAAILLGVFRYSRMELRRSGDRLVGEGGWGTRWRTELPLSRIQQIVVSQSALQRSVGVSRWAVRTAALREGADAGDAMTLVLPMVYSEHANALMTELIGVNSNSVAWHPPHPRGHGRALLVALARNLFLTLILIAVIGPPGGWLLAAAPIELLLASRRYRSQRWCEAPQAVGVQNGWPGTSTVWVSLSQLQVVSIEQGPWAARHRLAHLLLSVAGGSIALPWVSVFQARRMQQRLAFKTPQDPGRVSVGRPSRRSTSEGGAEHSTAGERQTSASP